MSIFSSKMPPVRNDWQGYTEKKDFPVNRMSFFDSNWDLFCYMFITLSWGQGIINDIFKVTEGLLSPTEFLYRAEISTGLGLAFAIFVFLLYRHHQKNEEANDRPNR